MADCLRCRITEHPLSRTVPRFDPAIEVFADDGIVAALDDGGEAFGREVFVAGRRGGTPARSVRRVERHGRAGPALAHANIVSSSAALDLELTQPILCSRRRGLRAC